MRNLRIEVEKEGWDESAIIEFLSKAFGPDYYTALNYKTRLFGTEPSHRPDNLVSARDDQGRLIGVLRIIERKLLVDGIDIKTGFVTSVAVHPDYRGRGIGKSLVQDAIDRLIQRGYVLAGVHGRRAVDGFYPKFGYHPVGRYISFRITSSFDDALPTALEIAQPPSQEEIAKWYKQQYESLSGSLVRSGDVWRFLHKKIELSRGACRLHALAGQGKMHGYIIVQDKKVIELAADSTIFDQIAPCLSSSGITDFALHPHHPYISFIRQRYNTIKSERLELNGGYMMMILNMETFLVKTLPLFKERSEGLPVDIASVRMLGYELEFETGRVTPSDGEPDVVFDSDRAALHAMIGFHDPQWQLAAHASDNKESLATIFPALGFHSSTIDEV